MNNQPIGIYDSGFGGLTLWRAVRERLPHESLIYLGDGKNCPYGTRPTEQIREFAFAAVERLLSMGCKLIVVACNTATAAAIEQLRAHYADIDLVGMEPAVKPACIQSRSRVVGVLATQRSIEGDMFHRTAAKYSNDVEVIAKFGEGFVEIVERSLEDTHEAEQQVRRIVEPMVEAGVDQIVLGCTHYPFLIPVIQRVAPNVNIIDPSPAVARRVEELLQRRDNLAESGSVARCKFITYADDRYRDALIRKSGVADCELWK